MDGGRLISASQLCEVVFMDGQRIQNITAEGLTYLKDDGSEGFIDFVACRERAFAGFTEPESLKQFQEINHLNDEQLNESIQRRKEWKYVGDRSILGEPWGSAPFIEFYTDPPIRFEFATEEEFHSVLDVMRHNHWRTHDLT